MITISPEAKILGSWKEIAAYLGKGVRTVQRWEQLHGLPVRRPVAAPQGVVYASREELDAWLTKQWSRRSATTEQVAFSEARIGETPSLVQMSKELRQANRELLASLRQTVDSVKQECATLALLIPQPAKPTGNRRDNVA
jgi:hypothetical protein